MEMIFMGGGWYILATRVLSCVVVGLLVFLGVVSVLKDISFVL